MLKPLHDNVILKKEEVEKKTASGIILTDSSAKEPAVARVIAVGDGIEKDGKVIPVCVQVDEQVVYKEYAGTKLEYQDEEYLIISEKDILAVIK